MKSRATRDFWKRYRALPPEIRKAARDSFLLWRSDPGHPSVRFKKIGDYWSARVTRDYRALGVKDGDTVIWFFIGNHSDYDKLI